jgi:hypothetical protein
VRAPYEAVAELRRRPGPVCGEPLPPAFLKHADEQTVVGLAAVYQAIHDHGLTPAAGTAPFSGWGVLAAPRFLGRPTLVGALQRFAAEGAWGVSPHLIPHRSLHSISGTVSLALKIHGPNFGVGGGPGAAAEVLLSAATMLECRRVPGVWVVLTAMDPEEPPEEAGRPAPGACFAGLALALTPVGVDRPAVRLRIVSGSVGPARGSAAGLQGLDLFGLQALLEAVQGRGPTTATAVQLLDDLPGVGSRIEVTRHAAAARRGRHPKPAPAIGGNGSAAAPLSLPVGVRTAEGPR